MSDSPKYVTESKTVPAAEESLTALQDETAPEMDALVLATLNHAFKGEL